MATTLQDMHQRCQQRRERGHAAVVMVVLLVTLSLMATAMIARTGNQIDVAVQQAGGVRTLYAAEAGLSMAARELSLATDEDGDGVVGSIGAGKKGPPMLDGAAFSVTIQKKAGQNVVTSSGRTATSIRQLVVTLE